MAGKVYLGDTFIGYSEKKVLTSFGGLNLTPGPLYQNTSTNECGICNTWDEYTSYGNNSPTIKTYFNWENLCDLFDSTGNNATQSQRKSYQATTSSGTYVIDNLRSAVSWSGVSDWRVPSLNDQFILFTGRGIDTSNPSSPTLTPVRNGSTVNDIANVTVVCIAVNGLSESTIPYATPSSGQIYGIPYNTVFGMLFIPDNKVLTGSTIISSSLNNYFTSTQTINDISYFYLYGGNIYICSTGSASTLGSGLPAITQTQLNEYISQGCVFMAYSGYPFTDTSGSASWMKPYKTSSGNSFNNIWLNTEVTSAPSSATFKMKIPMGASAQVTEKFVNDDLGVTVGTGRIFSSGFQTYLVRNA